MKIFFIRHGESEHNKAIREQGELRKSGAGSTKAVDSRDLPLTDEGKEQIQNALEKLPDAAGAFYCGDHIRTKQTADIVQSKYPEITYTIDPRINAAFCGSLDHKSFDEMQELTGIDFQKQVNDDTFDYRPWGGESAADVHNRVADFLLEICAKGDEHVIVVSSVEVIRSVYKVLFGDKAPTIMKYIRVKNGSVHEFDIEKQDLI